MMNILSICDNSTGVYILSYVKIAVNIICIVVPIGLILTCMIDALKSMMSHDDDMTSKTLKAWVSRSIAAVLIFLIPTIVYTISDIAGNGVDARDCIESASVERAKSLKENEDSKNATLIQKWKEEQEAKRKAAEEKAKAEKEAKKKARLEARKSRSSSSSSYATGYEANGNFTAGVSLTSVDLTDIGCTVTYDGTPREKLTFNVAVSNDIHSILSNTCDMVNSKGYINTMETAGSYADKAGYHGRGLAIDLFNNWEFVSSSGKKYHPYASMGEGTWSSYKKFICEVCDGKEDCEYNINYQIYYTYFKPYNWCWGGNWGSGSFDPMHYEKSDGGCSTASSTRISC